MADVVSAIGYVLHQEDSRLAGVVTNDPRDAGGRTRFGIAERFHPELTETGFFDEMPSPQALLIADKVYADTYAAPLMLGSINQQQVANAILSFAINEGVISSIKVLQDALHLDTDGKFGPKTLEAVNSMSNILAVLGTKQVAHYEAIVAAKPVDACFLNGWINRTKQNCCIAA